MAPASLPLAVGLAWVSKALATTPEFEQWAAKYEKHYRTHHEYQVAVENFLKNTRTLVELNGDAQDGAVYDHSPFSDMHPRDFKTARFPGSMDPAVGVRGGDVADVPNSAADAVDWRTQGAVTAVKDQGSCGSCWAESAVGNIESMWYLANKATLKAPVMLSVQEVIECDAHDYACYGGFPKGAYQYVIEHGGITSETNYPYDVEGKVICLANQTFNATCGDGMCDDPPLTSFCDQTCSDKTAPHKSVAKISSWVALTKGEDAMAAYTAQHGPISIGIDASGGGMGILFPWLQFYKSGVANPGKCTTKIDHGVLIVGYGVEGSTKYWIIKNSWGQKWGESGYFRLVRGEEKCGITLMATSAVVASTTPLLTV